MSAPLAESALRLATDAAAQGDFEAGYHLLMAAVHVADKKGDLKLLDEICALAREYEHSVDAMSPEHPLSTGAAGRRGTTPLFESIQVHAKAVVVRHRAEAQRHRAS